MWTLLELQLLAQALSIISLARLEGIPSLCREAQTAAFLLLAHVNPKTGLDVRKDI
jgi:hypothetical protein